MIPMDSYAAIEQSLRAKIDSGEWPNGTKLPSGRILSANLNASRETLRRIFKKLEKDGLVQSKPRSGIFVTSSHTKASKPARIAMPSQESRPAQIAGAIIEDITVGLFRLGSFLPQQKALTHKYRTSTVCLQKALRIVENARLLHREGPKIIIGPKPASAPSTKGEILFCARPRFAVRPRHPLMRFLVSVEGHANSAGLRLSPRLTMGFGVPARPFLGDIPSETRAVVCLVNELSTIIRPENKVFQSEIRKALRTGLPVIIFGVGGFPAISCASVFGPCDNLYLFGMDDILAGEEAATFAMALGHRQMAFFSFSTESWNHDRYAGLERKVRATLGPKGRTISYAAEFNKRELLPDLVYKNGTLTRILRNPVKKIMRNFEYSHPFYYKQLSQHAFGLATQNLHWPHMRPLFEKALQDKRITLWVCADSSVASVAMDVLKEKGMRLPQDMQLMIIDDDIRAIDFGITAHSFQMENVGYLAAHAAAQDILIRRKRNRVVICPHAVIDRGSVGRLVNR